MVKKTVTETIRVGFNEVLSALHKVGLSIPKNANISFYYNNVNDKIDVVIDRCYLEFIAKKEARAEYIY